MENNLIVATSRKVKENNNIVWHYQEKNPHGFLKDIYSQHTQGRGDRCARDERK